MYGSEGIDVSHDGRVVWLGTTPEKEMLVGGDGGMKGNFSRYPVAVFVFAALGLGFLSAPRSGPAANDEAAPEWILPVLASRAQFLNALHTDREGNTYITGYFAGLLDLDGIRLQGAGAGDPFLIKLDASGHVLWGRQATGDGWSGGRSLDTDAAGGVYLVGRFQGDLAFETDTLINAGGNDIFVAKYSALGDFRWARSIGGGGTDWGHGVAVDTSGNVFIAGIFEDTVHVGDEILVSGGASDPLLAKYDPDGAFLWARVATGSGADHGYEVAVDEQGNSYLVGAFVDDLTIGVDTLQASGESDAYVTKYGPNGSFAWVLVLAGDGSNMFEDVAVSADGDIYVAGSLQTTAVFAGQILRSAGGRDLVTARLAPDGLVRWAWTLGGPGDDGFSGFGQSVVILPGDDGDFRVATAFQDSLRIGEHILRSQGGDDVFVAHFAGPAEPLWAESCGGSEFEGFVGVGRDPDGATYASTNFTSESVNCGDQEVRRSEGQFGAAVMKYAE